MRFLGISAKALWLFLGAVVVTGVAVAILVSARLGWFGSRSLTSRRCQMMVADLQRTVEPEALRRASAEVVKRFTDGRTHRVAKGEMPDSIRRVMERLGLGEAIVLDGKILRLESPGGFGSCGVDIVPLGGDVVLLTNLPGVEQLQWKEGISVWEQSP